MGMPVRADVKLFPSDKDLRVQVKDDAGAPDDLTSTTARELSVEDVISRTHVLTRTGALEVADPAHSTIVFALTPADFGIGANKMTYGQYHFTVWITESSGRKYPSTYGRLTVVRAAN